MSGIAAAKNVGLFASEGEIVCFLDDDDAADNRMLEAHLEGHRAHPDERIAILGYTTWHPELEVTHFMRYLTEIGQHLFSYPSLEPSKVLDFLPLLGRTLVGEAQISRSARSFQPRLSLRGTRTSNSPIACQSTALESFIGLTE